MLRSYSVIPRQTNRIAFDRSGDSCTEHEAVAVGVLLPGCAEPVSKARVTGGEVNCEGTQTERVGGSRGSHGPTAFVKEGGMAPALGCLGRVTLSSLVPWSEHRKCGLLGMGWI